MTVKGEPTWVTTGSQAWANPDPTPDGEWVVTYTRDQPEGDLYVIRPDGTEPRQLTSNSGAPIDRLPRWSPDKTWIAFFSTRGGQFAVWKIRFDGSDLQQVASAPSVYPVWSADGTRLAVNSAADISGAGERTTRVLDPKLAWQAQTPLVLPLPDNALRPFNAQDWSPDSTRLAGQIGMTGGAKGIVIYTFASRAYERLTDFGEWPVWLPDSRRVLFVSGGRDYWVVDTRTKQTRKVFSVPGGGLGPGAADARRACRVLLPARDRGRHLPAQIRVNHRQGGISASGHTWGQLQRASATVPVQRASGIASTTIERADQAECSRGSHDGRPGKSAAPGRPAV